MNYLTALLKRVFYTPTTILARETETINNDFNVELYTQLNNINY